MLVVLIVAVIVQANARERARRAYQEALERLRRNPANPDLRGETLRLGRAYSNLTRNRRGVTLFDEVALMNDINAACAAAFQPPKPLPPTESVETRMAKLNDLRSKGLIDDAEYAERRQQIVSEI
ncbi:MAG TPA: SHOCT domain-containing protein [Thermoanaerobaculia bacterium]|nr:SHOCT domain-containing protein [Thermoanaerobaculia bacterium]